MTEAQKNIPASIQARLKHEAQEQGRPFAELLQYYGMERFLYRLSKSQYVDKFILKGGLLIYGWNIPLRRPTRDIDFRGFVDNNKRAIQHAIREVIMEPVPEDGMMFDMKTIRIEKTQVDADYEGIRVKFTGYLGKVRVPMQIDIGFSDVLASRVERIKYPTLLADTKTPHLKSYPKESLVSEKFHAMIRHAQLNSRFKDYYDIWLMADNFEFEAKSLQKAIEKTFAKRQTEISDERSVGLTTAFAETNRGRWTNFLKRFDLQDERIEDFVDVVETIWAFIEFPLALTSGKGSSKEARWIPQKGWI